MASSLGDGYFRLGPPRRNKDKRFTWEVIPGDLSRGMQKGEQEVEEAIRGGFQASYHCGQLEPNPTRECWERLQNIIFSYPNYKQGS